MLPTGKSHGGYVKNIKRGRNKQGTEYVTFTINDYGISIECAASLSVAGHLTGSERVYVEGDYHGGGSIFKVERMRSKHVPRDLIDDELMEDLSIKR